MVYFNAKKTTNLNWLMVFYLIGLRKELSFDHWSYFSISVFFMRIVYDTGTADFIRLKAMDVKITNEKYNASEDHFIGHVKCFFLIFLLLLNQVFKYLF